MGSSHRTLRRRRAAASAFLRSAAATMMLSSVPNPALLGCAEALATTSAPGRLRSLADLDSLRRLLDNLTAAPDPDPVPDPVLDADSNSTTNSTSNVFSSSDSSPSSSSSFVNSTRRAGNVDAVRRDVLEGVDALYDDESGGAVSTAAASVLGINDTDVDPQLPSRLRSLFGPHDEIALCHIPQMFPFGSWVEVSVVALALSHLNDGDGSVVPELDGLNDRCPIRFTFETINTGWKPVTAVDRVIGVTSRNGDLSAGAEYPKLGEGVDETGPLPCALLGMATSSMSMPSAIVSSLRGYPQVAYQATSGALNDASSYSLFGRTVPSDAGTAIPVILYYSRVLGVRYLAVLHVDSSYGNAYAEGLRDAAKVHAPEMTIYLVSHSNRIDETVKRLKETGCTYFFAVLWGGGQVLPYMDEAYEQGIAGTGHHNWMFSDSIGENWVSGRKNLPIGGKRHRALLGTSLVSAVGGMPGMDSFDRLDVALRGSEGLTPGDADYLRSKLPFGKNFNNTKAFIRGTGTHRPLLYDAAVALGLAACRATNTSIVPPTYFNGKEHFSAMANGVFAGASGEVVLNNKTGTRLPSSARFSIVNYVQDESKTTHNTTKFRKVRTSLFVDGNWTAIEPFVYNDNTTDAPNDLLDITVKNSHLSTGLRAGGLVMCALIVLQSIVFAVWTEMNKTSRVVKASQPIFLHVIAFGVLLMGTTIVPLSIDTGVASERGCDIACAAFPWLLFLGFNVSFSALFTKTHRINLIFSNPRFKRITVTAKDVMVPMVAMLTANILILGLWTGLSPLHWETTVVAADRHDRTLETSGQCRSDNPIPYVALLLAFNLGTLLYSMQQAYRARKISTEFAESEYIFRSMTAMLLVSFIGVPVLIIANDNASAFFFVMSAILFVVCSSMLCLIFVPKIIIHRKRRKEKKEKEAKKAEQRKAAMAFHGCGESGLPETSHAESIDLSSRASAHEPGIKIIGHPGEEEELREENRKLRGEIADLERRLQHRPASPSPGAQAVSSQSLSVSAHNKTCPHCSSILEDAFLEECSILLRPLVPSVPSEYMARVPLEEVAEDGSYDDFEQEDLDEAREPEKAQDPEKAQEQEKAREPEKAQEPEEAQEPKEARDPGMTDDRQ